MFDTQMVFLNYFFEKVDFEKKQQTTRKACKITQHAVDLQEVNELEDDLETGRRKINIDLVCLI